MNKIPIKDRVANKIACMLKTVKSGRFAYQRFLFTYFVYHFLFILKFDYPKLVEWKFILRHFPRRKGLRILDVGSTSNLFIHELARRGKIIAMDSRPYFERLPKKIKFVQCDILRAPFAPKSFDVVTIISVIEHIGLGFYDDPLYNDGDLEAMRKLKELLADGGVIFLTTLVGDKYAVSSDANERIYDKARFRRLIQDFKVINENYYIFRNRWVSVSSSEAFKEPASRFALACVELKA